MKKVLVIISIFVLLTVLLACDLDSVENKELNSAIDAYQKTLSIKDIEFNETIIINYQDYLVYHESITFRKEGNGYLLTSTVFEDMESLDGETKKGLVTKTNISSINKAIQFNLNAKYFLLKQNNELNKYTLYGRDKYLQDILLIDDFKGSDFTMVFLVNDQNHINELSISYVTNNQNRVQIKIEFIYPEAVND